jgi:hypothetical protein
MGQLITFALVGLMAALVMKTFQIATDLSEIKDILSEIKRNASDGLSAPASPANLIRAVNLDSAGNLDSLNPSGDHKDYLETPRS